MQGGQSAVSTTLGLLRSDYSCAAVPRHSIPSLVASAPVRVITSVSYIGKSYCWIVNKYSYT